MVQGWPPMLSDFFQTPSVFFSTFIRKYNLTPQNFISVFLREFTDNYWFVDVNSKFDNFFFGGGGAVFEIDQKPHLE